MIANKHITKIVAAIMAIAVCLCLCAMIFSEKLTDLVGGVGVAMEYESRLFDTSEIISINILMSSDEWDNMIANATSEEYSKCDVEVNGTTFYNVGIRPKGNTSLTSIASNPDTDRFSLKLEFDQYVEGQTCYGLDKLILNNNYADATNMKEALIYDMYAFLDADASLYNYAKISVDGEYWGIYLALEAVEDSFLLRNYGTENEKLYKPDSMDMNNIDNWGGNAEGGTSNGFDPSQFGENLPESFDGSQFEGMTPPNGGNMPGGAGNRPNEDTSSDTAAPSADMPDMGDFDFSDIGGMGGFSMGGNGANLNYSDDELSSYSTIWNSEVSSTSKADHKRVIKALKNISEGTDLEEYMDIDNLLKYMAVHVFSVNEDSLSGAMAHNYYLYETNGRLNLLPWDYNLSLGGMGGMGGGGGSTATSVVNDAIDNAFSGTDFFDTLMENEEYRAQYHAYLQQLVDEYIVGGGFDELYSRIRSQIDALVATDPTAFYSLDEYTAAAETLYAVVKLRGQSIDGQLAGTIPSTADEQRDSDALIDASHLDISIMGSMSMGGGRGGQDFGGFDFNQENTEKDNSESATSTGLSASGMSASGSTNTPPANGDSGAGGSPSEGGAAPPEGFDPSTFGGEMPEGFRPPSGDVSSQDDNTSTETNNDDTPTENPPSQSDNGFSRENFDPSTMGFGSTGTTSASRSNNIITYTVCFAILIAAVIFAMRYRRKPRKH